MYQFIKNLLFLFDPEKVHRFSMKMLQWACRIGLIRKYLKRIQQSPITSKVNLMGLEFVNPVGLGAGFDKNAKYLTELETLGFGFVEIGTVTPLPQDGNETPRLFRLPKDKALINRMGFNNEGADKIAKRLSQWRNKNKQSGLIIGGNIGKNKITPNELAWQDYLTCFRKLFDVVDYFVVNVSSPNTPGLRELQEKDSLKIIFQHLQQENTLHQKPKPILLKIAPDLTNEQLDEIISLTEEVSINGLIISNTTIDRAGLQTSNTTVSAIGAGGLSGLPVQKKSNEVLRYIAQRTKGKMLLIGSGGIFTGADAQLKMDAGAQLIQVWTGFVYEGPAIVKKINRYLTTQHA